MKVKVKHCTAYNPEFINMKPGSIHEVIRQEFVISGVWVQGVTQPVLLLNKEYEVIEDNG